MKMIILIISISLCSPLVTAKTITYPGLKSNRYVIQLLRLSLSYLPDKNYQLQAFGRKLPKVRAFHMMRHNKGIDIMFGGSSIERERYYLPVRIPLLKGLHGWRIALISQKNPNLLLTHSSPDDFKSLTAGQLQTWSDSQILNYNKVNLLMTSSYQGLFQMLSKGRIDYFPRSIIEIENELEKNSSLGLMIDKHVLMHYPTAYYYYVNKDNTQLAADIEYGLEKAIADGSFNKLFNKHFSAMIERLSLNDRKVITLSNPFLADKTPFQRKELWFEVK